MTTNQKTGEAETSGWEILRWFEVDSGHCMIGALGAVDLGSRVPVEPLPRPHDAVIVEKAGQALVVCDTGADCALPLEIAAGGPPACRICFTDDVDDLTGSWTPIGTITLPSACTAGDPFRTGELHRVTFELPPGTYRAEIFRPDEPTWDCLALRVTKG